jgi:hypothetical protein
LSRGELPLALLVAGSLAAVAVGFSLTLLIGALRRRRSAPRPEPVPAEPMEDFVDARTTLHWPTEDADAFRTAPRPDDASPAIDEQAPAPFAAYTPSAPRDAAWAERWAAHEATSEIARQGSGWPSDTPAEVTPETAAAPEPVRPPPPLEETEVADTSAVDTVATGTSAGMTRTWERPDPPVPPAAITAIQSTLATRAETPSARSTLGTPDAPLVVELRDERKTAAGRRAGPNLPLVAVIGTVAVGVAFAAGAAVGAALGVGAGAAIGLAFAGGAGVAIGATVALLGASRR